MYLAWFDADRDKSSAKKVADARARYVQRFGAEPLVCMVNPVNVCDVVGIKVVPLAHIGEHCFWIGQDE